MGHGSRALVQDVCLAVRPGQLVALIGPNGSGKTTILRLVMTLEELTGGYIHIGGTPLQYEEVGGSLGKVSTV